MPICVGVPCMCRCLQKKALRYMELRAKRAAKHSVLLVLGTKLGSSAKVSHAFFTAEPALQALAAVF